VIQSSIRRIRPSIEQLNRLFGKSRFEMLDVQSQLIDTSEIYTQLDELKRVEHLALTRCQRERADRGGA
jgi:hypothetical protein